MPAFLPLWEIRGFSEDGCVHLHGCAATVCVCARVCVDEAFCALCACCWCLQHVFQSSYNGTIRNVFMPISGCGPLFKHTQRFTHTKQSPLLRSCFPQLWLIKFPFLLWFFQEHQNQFWTHWSSWCSGSKYCRSLATKPKKKKKKSNDLRFCFDWGVADSVHTK